MKVFLIAGEPSGDRLGGALMAGLKTLVPDVQFSGVGGPDMQVQGLESLYPMQELSVMGIAEVLPRFFDLKRRIEETAAAAAATEPDVLITIDSPDFCLRVAARVRAVRPVHTVHYVAPSVWAWRPGRAHKMAKVIDHVLALLPFEPPYMQAAGMDCDFVGHPVVTEPAATAGEIAALRQSTGLGDAPVLLALPGSRRSEIGRLMPIFGAALERFLDRRPDTRVVVPTVAAIAGDARAGVAGWPGKPVVLEAGGTEAAARKRAAFATADLALAASGTVSLELAAAGTPMVIAYKPNWLSWQLAKVLVKTDTVTLVNLVSETRSVPECLGPNCTPDAIDAALRGVEVNPEAQTAAMQATMRALGQGGEAPGLRAARAVLGRMAG